MKSRLSACCALLFLLAGCRSAPTTQVPEPLPETLEWALPAVEGAFLGVRTQENDSGSLDSLFFEPGARVSRVIESSPAFSAGVQVGDVVLALDDQEVDDPAALDALVDLAGAGAEVSLRVQRGDTVFAVPVTLRAREGAARPPEVLFRKDPGRSRAGWATGRGGAVLVSAPEDSPVFRAGLELGDVVVAVEGRGVHSARALIRELARYEYGARVSLSVSDEEETREVDLTLASVPRRVTKSQVPILYQYKAQPDGSRTSFVLLDLYVISLFRYTRSGAEREYRFLRWIRYSSGVGELVE